MKGIREFEDFEAYLNITGGVCQAVDLKDLPSEAEYVGTLYDGAVVRHVYEVNRFDWPSEHYEVSSLRMQKGVRV